MQILLCAATEREIAPTLQAFSYNNGAVRFLITGVGLMVSTYALTKEVTAKRPGFILQAGVAGSLNPERPLAQTVLVKRECIGDLGVEENGTFRSLFDLKLADAANGLWQEGWLVNENDFLNHVNLPVVNGVTVNQITTSPATIPYYQHELKAEVESMEGAALHYIALQEKIPFLQLRSLSNFIGERDKSRWMMSEAIENLNRELQRIIQRLQTT